MADQHASSAAGQSVHEHHAPGGIGKYIAVFVALCLLTSASFLTYFDFWDERVPNGMSWAFMMAVSCTKAMLVILFFMHLLWEANWKYVLTIPATMMSVFLVLMLVPDVGCRVTRYSDQRWLHAAQPRQATHDGPDGQLHQRPAEHAPGDNLDH